MMMMMMMMMMTTNIKHIRSLRKMLTDRNTTIKNIASQKVNKCTHMKHNL